MFETTKKLLEGYIESGEFGLLSAASGIASKIGGSGNEEGEREIRRLIDRAVESETEREVDVCWKYVTEVKPAARLSSLVTRKDTYNQIQRIILENRSREKIRSHGLEPDRKLLFLGRRRGCGQKVAAEAIASELGLKLFVVRFDYLATEQNDDALDALADIFALAEKRQGVYLFVEEGYTHYDSKPLLVYFWRRLEIDKTNNIYISSDNETPIDIPSSSGIYDAVVKFYEPQSEELKRLLETRLGQIADSEVDFGQFADPFRFHAHSDASHAADNVLKSAIAEGLSKVSNDYIMEHLF